jgi:hypothetical protein
MACSCYASSMLRCRSNATGSSRGLSPHPALFSASSRVAVAYKRSPPLRHRLTIAVGIPFSTSNHASSPAYHLRNAETHQRRLAASTIVATSTSISTATTGGVRRRTRASEQRGVGGGGASAAIDVFVSDEFFELEQQMPPQR